MSNIVDTASALGQAASQQPKITAPQSIIQNPVSVQDSSGNTITLSQRPVNLVKVTQHQAPRTINAKPSNSLK